MSTEEKAPMHPYEAEAESAAYRRSRRRGEEVIGKRYVVSLSGVRGAGPWVGKAIGCTDPQADMTAAFVWMTEASAECGRSCWAHTYPDSRVFRLVRRERHRAEEAAVVEAAMAFEEACVLLRAKRGGK